jgi:hypothetical protein
VCVCVGGGSLLSPPDAQPQELSAPMLKGPWLHGKAFCDAVQRPVIQDAASNTTSAM